MSQENKIWMGELDYSFNLFYLIVNLDCVPNLQTSLWKTTASSLSMNLMALILTFIELILPKNQSITCKWNENYAATTTATVK